MAVARAGSIQVLTDVTAGEPLPLPGSSFSNQEDNPMPTRPAQSLSDKLKSEREAMQREALDAINALRSIASSHKLAGTSDELAKSASGLQSETFSMIVMGRFKNGKSTLINALLGGTTKPVNLHGAQGPMVVDDLPATAVLSQVTYADKPFIRARKMDDSTEQWTLDDYLRDSTIGFDTEETRRRFANMQQFEIGFPAKLCESNVILYDSPGLDENKIRTVITMNAVRRCDAALMVFTTNALGGESELSDDAKVRKDGTKVFVVVNVFNGRPVDDRLRGYVWNKYVHEHLHGPEWAGQDLTDYNIFFVNAKLAADARYGLTGQAVDVAYRESGLAALEERLGHFLIHERFSSHLTTFSTKAINLSDEILELLRQQQAAGTAKRDAFRKAWQQQQGPLDELRAWPKKLRLARIVGGYRDNAITNLTSGVTRLIAEIRRDLPAHLEGVTLPTQETATVAAFHQKQLTEEAISEINSFISGRVSNWSENQASTLLKSIADQLSAEVGEEVTDLADRFNRINMALTGADSAASGARGSAHNTADRAREAIADALFGDINPELEGGANGFRGFLGGLAGAGAAGWLLIGVLGITSGLVLVPIALAAAAASVLIGSAGLVDRIKKRALAATDEKLAELPGQVSNQIENGIRARFAELESTISAEVNAYIDTQVRNIEAQEAINQQGEADQVRTLQRLKATEQEVRKHRAALEDTVAKAKQVS